MDQVHYKQDAIGMGNLHTKNKPSILNMSWENHVSPLTFLTVIWMDRGTFENRHRVAMLLKSSASELEKGRMT